MTTSPLSPTDKTGGRVILTSGFRTPSRPTHYGIDLGTTDGIEIGVNLYAVRSGVILRVGQDPGVGAGKNIWLLDDTGEGWKYFHMNDYVVTAGQRVREGQLVGHVGNTGTSAAHLHLQRHAVGGSSDWSRWTDATAIDPWPVIGPTLGQPVKPTIPAPQPPEDEVTEQDKKDIANYAAIAVMQRFANPDPHADRQAIDNIARAIASAPDDDHGVHPNIGDVINEIRAH